MLQIIKPGMYNTNQGPDFLNAQIRLDDTMWAGSIELHVNSSEWRLHNHSTDPNYNNVILHVVWNDDNDPGLAFPTLELQSRISGLLLVKYEELMQAKRFIPCENHFSKVNALTLAKWKERLIAERLQQRALYIKNLLKKNNYHWEETFWWMIARNFGMNINSDAFEKIAQSVPVNIIAKHKNQLIQLEALLLGQAGLLDKDFEDGYPIMLKKEYLFLQKKYKLSSTRSPLYFLRMRPANFPTIRLAQLAALINQSQHMFSAIKEIEQFKQVEKLFSVTANDYWHYHYIPDEASAFRKKTLGRQMLQNIINNTVIPMLYAYGYFTGTEAYQDKAMHWIEQASAEKNHITMGYENLGAINKNAFDSQSLLQLKKEYCDQRRCLQCAIGNEILREVS